MQRQGLPTGRSNHRIADAECLNGAVDYFADTGAVHDHTGGGCSGVAGAALQTSPCTCGNGKSGGLNQYFPRLGCGNLCFRQTIVACAELALGQAVDQNLLIAHSSLLMCKR